MAINGAKNAGIMAASILAINDKDIADKLKTYKNSLANNVIEKAENLEQIGYLDYLKDKK